MEIEPETDIRISIEDNTKSIVDSIVKRYKELSDELHQSPMKELLEKSSNQDNAHTVWHVIGGKWTHLVKKTDSGGTVSFYTDGIKEPEVPYQNLGNVELDGPLESIGFRYEGDSELCDDN